MAHGVYDRHTMDRVASEVRRAVRGSRRLKDVGATEAGRELATPRRARERKCHVCRRRFPTSGCDAYCGHACKKRAYCARKREAALRGTDEDLLKKRDSFFVAGNAGAWNAFPPPTSRRRFGRRCQVQFDAATSRPQHGSVGPSTPRARADSRRRCATDASCCRDCPSPWPPEAVRQPLRGSCRARGLRPLDRRRALLQRRKGSAHLGAVGGGRVRPVRLDRSARTARPTECTTGRPSP